MEKKPSILAWLFAAGLCAGLLPDFTMMLWAAQSEKPLPRWSSLVILLAAACISLLCFLRAVDIRFGKEPAGTEIKTDRLSYLTGLFPCVLAALIAIYGSDTLLPVLAAVYVVKKGFFWILIGILLLVLLLVMGILFFCYLCRCRKMPLQHPIRRFFARIYLGIPMTVLLWASLLAVPFGLVVLQRLWEEPGVLLRHLMLTVSSFLLAVLLNAALLLAEKMMAGAAQIPEAETTTEEGGPVSRKRSLPSLISLALCLLLFLSHNLTQLTGNEAGLLKTQLKDALVEYGFCLAAADLGGAAGIAGEALEQMDSALKEAPEEERKAIQKVCDRYEIFRTDGQALVLLEQFKRAGGADDDLVEDALLLSEEYPENRRVQYTAAEIGSSLTYDKAKHYERTTKAILRWKELYEKETKLTEEERIVLTKQTARKLLKVYQQEEAAKLLEELKNPEEDAELCELLAQCYDHTGRQEEAYALAAAYCESREDSPYLMYYAALSALKLEKIQECLTYTSRLASYTAGCEGEELKNCDTWLFELLEFLTLNDNSSYTGFQYDVYQELTEEEEAVIDANPFFRNYLDSVYLAYRSKSKSEPEEAFAKIEAVLNEKPELASAWYLRGVIASNAGGEYREKAIEYYRKAGTLNDRIPAIWYAMAREYDRLGEYEKGIEACKKALSLLPEQDHGSDWYGINYHCSRLLRSLQEEIEK